jgi:hypothetical protein
VLGDKMTDEVNNEKYFPRKEKERTKCHYHAKEKVRANSSAGLARHTNGKLQVLEALALRACEAVSCWTSVHGPHSA